MRAAVRAVQCQACLDTVDRVWLLGTDWIHRHSEPPESAILKRHLKFAEHTQVGQL